MKEIDLQKQIIKWINSNGGFVWRTNNGQFALKSPLGGTRWFKCGITGGSDIQGVWRDGRGLYVEIKTGSKDNKKNQPRENQVAFLEAIKKRGGIAFTAWSLDEVIEMLEK